MLYEVFLSKLKPINKKNEKCNVPEVLPIKTSKLKSPKNFPCTPFFLNKINFTSASVMHFVQRKLNFQLKKGNQKALRTRKIVRRFQFGVFFFGETSLADSIYIDAQLAPIFSFNF